MTWIEWARALIKHIIKKYRTPGVSLIVMVLPTYAAKTELQRWVTDRDAADLKRLVGSLDTITALGRARQPEDKMPNMFATLAKSQQEKYMPMVCDEVTEQMMTPSGEWNASTELGSDCNLCLIGGQMETPVAFVPHGRRQRVLISSGVQVVKADLERQLKTAACAGDTLATMFHSARTILTAAFQHSRASRGQRQVDCFLHFFTENENKTLALASYFVFSLHEDMKKGRIFRGSMFIRAQIQSVKQILKISTPLRRSLGFDDDTNPTGDGLFLDIDVISLFYRLQELPSLSYMDNGEQMVALCTAGYAFILNDVIKMEGYAFKDYFRALESIGRSESLRDHDSCSPILPRPIPFSKDPPYKELSEANQLCLYGSMLTLTFMTLSDKATNNFLTRKYPLNVLSNPSGLYEHALITFGENPPTSGDDDSSSRSPAEENPDYIINASNLLSGSNVKAPDPLAKLLGIAAINIAFRLLVVDPYLPQLKSPDRFTTFKTSPFRWDKDDRLVVEQNLFQFAPELRKKIKGLEDP